MLKDLASSDLPDNMWQEVLSLSGSEEPASNPALMLEEAEMTHSSQRYPGLLNSEIEVKSADLSALHQDQNNGSKNISQKSQGPKE